MPWTIPNTLTVLRLLAAPGVAVMFLYFARPWADWFAMLLFVGAAITDYFDGYLARLWKQESRFGAMLDPIADKAMVVIALLVLTGFSGMDPWILLPATVIIFREIFVSGLREFLGDQAKALQVTKLAKYKTALQMTAMTFLFAKGIFQHEVFDRTYGMGYELADKVLRGEAPDEVGITFYVWASDATWWVGTVLLWIAAALTLWTGVQYFQKSVPFFREDAA
jgi:CDP-diacylglycerol--glycerol-3-phosphate 3-phosphatidyltransferase